MMEQQALEDSTDNDDLSDGRYQEGHLRFSVTRYIDFHVTCCLITASFIVVLLTLILLFFTQGLNTQQYLTEHE